MHCGVRLHSALLPMSESSVHLYGSLAGDGARAALGGGPGDLGAAASRILDHRIRSRRRYLIGEGECHVGGDEGLPGLWTSSSNTRDCSCSWGSGLRGSSPRLPDGGRLVPVWISALRSAFRCNPIGGVMPHSKIIFIS